MFLIWTELGIEKEYQFGVRLCGLQIQGQRPDTVIFTDEEVVLSHFVINPFHPTREDYQKIKRYIYNVIYPCLKKKKELGIPTSP